MRRRLTKKAAAGDVPEPGNAVGTSGKDAPAVWAKACGPDHARVNHGLTDRLACGEVPYPCRLVEARGDAARAVRAEPHRRHIVRMR